MVKALNRASSFLRGQLSSAIHLRYMPSMNFVYDESFDEANRIDAIIHRPEVARDLVHKLEEQVEEDIDGDRD